MKKEELKKLRTLNATKAMMRKAAADHPKTERKFWGSYTRYDNGIYMRAQQLNGYLKVALFLVGRMRQGNNKPVYEIFIDPKKGEFITWDCTNEKWSNAKIDNLEYPKYTWHSGKYINSGGYRIIKDILNVSKGGYAGILEYQNNIRADELKKSYRRETDPWDLDMEQIPEVPKDWKRWIDRIVIDENYIFYQYKKGGAKEGWCTFCKKWVPIREPRHNKAGSCRVCHKKITYKSTGKAGGFDTDLKYAYLIQKCEDGFVIRSFRTFRHYQKDMYGIPDTEHNKEPEINIYETRRCIYTSPFSEPRVYIWKEYRDRSLRWCEDSYTCRWWSTSSYYSPSEYWRGTVYKRTLPGLKKILERTGLVEYVCGLSKSDPEEYLKALKKQQMSGTDVKSRINKISRGNNPQRQIQQSV